MITGTPWELSEPGAEGVDILSRDFPEGRQMRIATVQPWPGYERTARLMAASKEMYAELFRALAVITNPQAFDVEQVRSDIKCVLAKAVPR